MYGFLADVVVFVHVLYVAFVVLGQLAIVAGAMLRRQWARNPWFRFTHLLAIGIVAYEAVNNLRCPLTVWEESFRLMAGQSFDSSQTFLGRLLHDLLFIEGMPESFFTTLYLAALIVVVQGLVMYPPRRFVVGHRDTPSATPATA